MNLISIAQMYFMKLFKDCLVSFMEDGVNMAWNYVQLEN